MLSVSMLSGYLYCPRKIYLNYTLKLKEPPKAVMVLGTIRHKVFEGINNIEDEIVSSIKEGVSYEDLFSAYKMRYLSILKSTIAESREALDDFGITPSEAFEKMKDSVIEEAGQRALNVDAFIRNNQVFGRELWEKLTPKILSEFTVSSDRLGIRGIVDRIEMFDDFMIPIELKTGKSPDDGAWPSHTLQIAAYMAMLSGKQRRVGIGRIIYLDSSKTVEIRNNPFVIEEVKKAVERTKKVLFSKTPPGFCSNENKCNACGLKEQCHDPEFIKNRLSEVFKTKE